MVIHPCNPITWEAEAGGLGIQPPPLHSTAGASWGSVIHCPPPPKDRDGLTRLWQENVNPHVLSSLPGTRTVAG